MNALDRRLELVERYAAGHGWTTERVAFTTDDGTDAVQLNGAQDGGRYGFTFAACLGPTGRVQVLALDGNPRARFVVAEATGRYWFGPFKSYRHAIADPDEWTGANQ